MKVQVIEKKKGRIDRTTGEIIKGNLKVCAYARVNTEKEEQLNSYKVYPESTIKLIKSEKLKHIIEKMEK